MARLRDPTQRDPLLTEVWGPKPLRDQVREATKAAAVSAGGFGLADGCGACDGLAGADCDVLAGIVLVAAVIFFGWLILAWAWHALRAWQQRPRPNGGSSPQLPADPYTCSGMVLDHAGLAYDPLTGESGVAFALELAYRHRWWSRPSPMVRDAATVGFDVRLETGERLRVPAGSFLADLSTAGTRPDPWQVDLHLTALQPGRARDDDLDPFPGDVVRRIAIRPGDRIELSGQFVPVIDALALPGTYREPPPTVLMPEGAFTLRLLRSVD